ncbi:MAG: M48 family metalloprotease [Haloarculaceae archaeon]
MRRLWIRLFMVLVGVAVFTVYAAAALGGYLLLTWLIAEPPDLVTGLVAVGVFTVTVAYLSYRVGTQRLLSTVQAVELSRRRAPTLYRRLERLSLEMDVDQPPILVANLGVPNALSLGGPRKGVIVLDQSLLSLLTIDELEGILAHELAHMESYDTFVQTLAVSLMRSLVGVLTLFLLPLLLLLHGIDRAMAWILGRPANRRPGLAGLIKQSIQTVVGLVLSVGTLLFLAYSRRREFAADSRAANVTGNPVALARALSKIHRATSPKRGIHSLLYIHGDESEDDGLQRLLSTHPPIEDRVEQLLDRADRAHRRHHIERLQP